MNRDMLGTTLGPPDRRYLRASNFVAMALQIVDSHLRGRILDDRENRVMRDIHDELFDLAHKHGVEVIDDHMRREAGLPPRDARGWTAEELYAYENRKLQVMLQPIAPVIIEKK